MKDPDHSTVLSLDTSIRSPIHGLDENFVLLHSGYSIVVLNTSTCERTSFQLEDGSGIGCLAVSSAKTVFAVGGKSLTAEEPKIYIYETLSSGKFEVIAVLENGAKKRFDAMDFSTDGTLLATVSGHPDYSLTLWKWKTGDVVLRSKAFSQDVYRVKFSKFFENRLITSGMGLIKFWKIENTFTGMKLQGALGKFGKVELVDVLDFVELSNGDVISASDVGDLLLWSDAAIKAVLRCPRNSPCHKGPVNFLGFDVKEEHIITASSDGTLKLWDPQCMIMTDQEENIYTLEVNPAKVYDLNQAMESDSLNDCKIKYLVQNRDHCVVFMESGGVIQLSIMDQSEKLPSGTMKPLWEYGANGISALEIFNESDCFATAGGDGVITLYNYRSKSFIYRTKRFSSAATCLSVLPSTAEAGNRVCVAGFRDGTIRVLSRCLDQWKLLSSQKPHKWPVVFVLFSPDGAILAAGSTAGRVFFFDRQDAFRPVGYCDLDLKPCSNHQEVHCTCACFGELNSRLFVGTTSGTIFQITIPILADLEPSSGGTYLLEVEMQALEFPAPSDTRDEDLLEGSEWPVICVSSLVWREEEQLLISFGGYLCGKVYMFSPQKASIERCFELQTKSAITKIEVLKSSDWIFVGSKDGSVCGWNLDQHDEQASEHSLNLHDMDQGAVTGLKLSPTGRIMISAGKDGSLLVLENPWLSFHEAADIQAESIPTLEEDGSHEVEDITRADFYTIDEAKKREEEESTEQKAADKKRRIRNYIEDLRRQFQEIKKENASRPFHQKLAPYLLLVDENLRERVAEETQQRINEVKRRYGFALEKEMIGLLKLRKQFFDGIEQHSESLSALDDAQILLSFSIQSIPPELYTHLSFLQQKIQGATAIDKDLSRDLKSCIEPCENEDKVSSEEGKITALGTTAARRSQQRKKRQENIRLHELSKPNQENSNMQDLEAIERARNTIGDFKLKSDLEELSKEAKESLNRKRLEIANIILGIRGLHNDFNLVFCKMKEAKQALIQAANKNQPDLGLSSDASREPLFSGSCDANNTMLDLSNDMDNTIKQVQAFKDGTHHTPIALNHDKLEVGAPTQKVSPLTMPVNKIIDFKGAAPLTEQYANQLTMQYRKELFEKRRAKALKTFVKNFNNLCREKLDIECNIKFLEIIKLVKEDELSILETLQGEENEISMKLRAKTKEKKDLKEDMNKLHKHIDEKLAQDSSIKDKKDIHSRFDSLVPLTHPHRAFLHKHLVKQAPNNEQQSDVDSSDESVSISDEEEEVDDEYPDDLDKALFEKVLKLNEGLAECNRRSVQLQSSLEDARKELEILQKKTRTIDSSLQAFMNDLLDFNRRKQMKLNKVQSLVVLRPSQIQIPAVSHPDATGESILIAREDIKILANRPRELDEERQELKRVHGSLKKDFIQLKQDKETKILNLNDLEEKLEEMQMLKFGQVLDLDLIDHIQVTGANKSKCSLLPQETVFQKKLDDLELEVKTQREALEKETITNTELLQKLIGFKMKDIEERQRPVSTQLEVPVGETPVDNSQRKRMLQLIQTQAQQILNLQKKIQQFKRKDTLVYV